MKKKTHRCIACGTRRLEKFMMPEYMQTLKTGKPIIKYMCGNCEEENRGWYKKLK